MLPFFVTGQPNQVHLNKWECWAVDQGPTIVEVLQKFNKDDEKDSNDEPFADLDGSEVEELEILRNHRFLGGTTSRSLNVTIFAIIIIFS